MTNRPLLALILPMFVLAGIAMLGFVFWGIAINNQLVRLDQAVAEKGSQVQNVHQLRSDLVGNLVETVKGYAGHERSTLEAVTQARASATGIRLTPEALKDPAALERFQQAQGALQGALSRLMVSVERYPELKANQNFMDLQRQLTAIEGRILIERQRFNFAVRAYNTRVRLFPGNVLASTLGYTTKPFFEAEAGASTVPKVQFDSPAKK